MYKKSVITLSKDELLRIGGACTIDMDHELDERSFTGTGVRPIFVGFRDENYKKLDKKVVELRVLEYLRGHQIIDDINWRFKWIPGHHWSLPDDYDGSRSSVYTLEAEVFQSERIKI